jgi:hypothetical protein
MKKNNLNNKSKINQDKEETILVWLDSGPYVYTHLGIITALSKLRKFNFIGIINSKQDINFLQKQNFIQFKKLLYYPECYIGKSTFNLSNIKKIEEQFDLKLWLDIFTDRNFYKFYTYFHKFTREEILIIIENSLLFFIDILEKEKPKMILMQPPGENVSNILLYELAKKMNIQTIMSMDIHYRNHIHISSNNKNDEISKKIEKTIKKNNEPFQIYDKQFIKNKNYTDVLKTISSYDSSIKSFSKKISHYIKRLSNNLEPIYLNVGKTKYRLIQNRLHNSFEVKKRERFLDNYAKKTLRDEKFLYFPLQSEPEASILMNTSFYSNQITLIETIAKSIPINYVLYVKEHPLQKIKLWRSIDDYKKIGNIPNVRFLHPSVNAQEVLEKSQGVIAISGATGFEALFYHIPVILFGDEYYDKLSMVTKIEIIKDLPRQIRNALFDFKFNERELSICVKVLKEFALPVPYYSILKDGVSLSSIQRNHNNFNLTNLEFEKFIKKWEKEFTLLVKTILIRSNEMNKK